MKGLFGQRMLRKVVAVYCEKKLKLVGRDTEVFSFKPGGIYQYRYPLRDQESDVVLLQRRV
jgi:hypothetical protein